MRRHDRQAETQHRLRRKLPDRRDPQVDAGPPRHLERELDLVADPYPVERDALGKRKRHHHLGHPDHLPVPVAVVGDRLVPHEQLASRRGGVRQRDDQTAHDIAVDADAACITLLGGTRGQQQPEQDKRPDSRRPRDHRSARPEAHRLHRFVHRLTS
ncbi:MAG: hypothetical protein Kow0062_05910 [Acidobacteriota bacterium]